MERDRDLELMYEIGCIRHIQRVWKQMLGAGFANLAEHHFRVAWLSLMLSRMEGQGNEEKILKMAFVHDLSESRTGDVHYISRLYTQRDELKAVKDILAGTLFEKDFVSLWDEYEKRESIEAKIVKDADFLDIDLELHEQASKGNNLEQQWHEVREKSVWPKLYTESAKKVWKKIIDSNVHDWHFFAPNRHNTGDWKI